MWGNHSYSQYGDLNHGYILKDNKPESKVKLTSLVNEEWMNIKLVKKL